MSRSLEYASFLIRLWREVDQDPSVARCGWHSEVEHIQTGERWSFDTLEALLDFLHREATDPFVHRNDVP